METETLKYGAERERGHVHRHIHCVFLSIVADDFNVPTLIPVPSIKFYCTKWMGRKDDKIRLRSKHRHFDVHNFQIQSWKQRTHFSTFERNWWMGWSPTTRFRLPNSNSKIDFTPCGRRWKCHFENCSNSKLPNGVCSVVNKCKMYLYYVDCGKHCTWVTRTKSLLNTISLNNTSALGICKQS